MSTSANDLVLSKKREKILKSLYRGKKLSHEEVYNAKYNFLIYYSLIVENGYYYVISEKGIQYILSHKKDKFRFWFPTVVSLLALIISVVALFR